MPMNVKMAAPIWFRVRLEKKTPMATKPAPLKNRAVKKLNSGR